jgi:hypothetical protein
VGKGEASVATIQSGLEPVLPEPPARLTVSDIGNVSVVIQFKPGFDGNSAITKWSVEALSARNATWTKIYEVSDPEATTLSVRTLVPYMEYSLRLVAHNIKGPSPPSQPTSTFRTLPGLPGPPSGLAFSQVTMTSLKVSWDQPASVNGEILGYSVSYQAANQEENYSKQVMQRVSENFMYVTNLEEQVLYTFSVRAQTVEYGPPAAGLVVTGPRPGSPGRPRDLALSQTLSAIVLSWTNSKAGKGPLQGYYIQSRPKDGDKWRTEVRTSAGVEQKFSISYQSLLPLTTYHFRVIAYSEFGISAPCTTEETVETPSEVYLKYSYLKTKPFYREMWFVAAMAGASILIIVMVAAILCVKSKTYKYGMVNYSERNGAKEYNENPDNSLTDEPSEILSTDSESDSGWASSSDPHSFVHHYTIVNNTFRQSWREEKSIQQRALPMPSTPRACSYSSLAESSDQDLAVVSLNGTKLVKSRSRAPLPGFSSFA